MSAGNVYVYGNGYMYICLHFYMLSHSPCHMFTRCYHIKNTCKTETARLIKLCKDILLFLY